MIFQPTYGVLEFCCGLQMNPVILAYICLYLCKLTPLKTAKLAISIPVCSICTDAPITGVSHKAAHWPTVKVWFYWSAPSGESFWSGWQMSRWYLDDMVVFAAARWSLRTYWRDLSVWSDSPNRSGGQAALTATVTVQPGVKKHLCCVMAVLNRADLWSVVCARKSWAVRR